jgi:membrane-anchored protein YejM (alkaline phosphatase superfamily)
MQTSTLAQLKKELQTLPQPQLVELCVRLAKYKKENKELVHYLLFEATDEQAFIKQVKQEITEQFKEVNTSHVYYAKKTIRKILRGVNKHAKYSGIAQTNIELLIYFLQHMRKLEKLLYESNQLMNLYEAQIKKIHKELGKLHEDLQYDYQKELEDL